MLSAGKTEEARDELAKAARANGLKEPPPYLEKYLQVVAKLIKYEKFLWPTSLVRKYCHKATLRVELGVCIFHS